MFSFFRRKLTPERVRELVDEVFEASDGDSRAAAWEKAQPLLKASKESRDAAIGLVSLAKEGAFELPQALEAAAAIARTYEHDPQMLGVLGEAFEGLCDVRYLNAAPPDDPELLDIADRLLQLEQTGDLSGDEEVDVLRGLGTAARLLGRAWDEVTERCERRLVELQPDNRHFHYNLGLFFKTRGRFEEGLAANQAAFDRGGSTDNAVQWNLAICATGAGRSERALEVWKGLGHQIEIGRFGLPDGPYQDAKVRLAEFPLAERDGTVHSDDPGLEETVWVERLSPCHGIIRVALFQDLGVDWGDVILFDGAPITYHEVAGERVPVFPHLATLVRTNHRVIAFGGTQREARQIAGLSTQLPADTVLYPHTENFRLICQQCWEGGKPHEHHGEEPAHRIILGKLCFPPDADPAALLATLDRIAAEAAGVQLFIPDLAALAGDATRAEVERRRLTMITETT